MADERKKPGDEPVKDVGDFETIDVPPGSSTVPPRSESVSGGDGTDGQVTRVDAPGVGDLDGLLSGERLSGSAVAARPGGDMATTTAAFVPVPRIGGRYRVLKPLGRGGMGEVCLAFDEILKLNVAIKTMLPERENSENARRMRDEAAVAIRLTHPNIMRIYDLHFSEREQFIVMEYVEGRSLDSILRERRTLRPAEAMEIARQVAAGLDCAHDAGVLHRDIKPQNIMVSTRRRAADAPETVSVKILDFGIAKVQQDVRTGGTIAGTLGFIAPEQLHGRRYDRRADVFALGVMTFMMLTGQMPFEGRGLYTDQSRPRRAELFSSEVNLVLAKVLAFDPATRWARAGTFVDALDRAIRKGGDCSAAVLPSTLTAAELSDSQITAQETSDLDPAAAHSQSNTLVAPPGSITPAIDGAPMAFIPAGSFIMGDDRGEPDEGPEHRVTLSAYHLDIHPITNSLYVQFLNEVKTHLDDMGRAYVALGPDRAIRIMSGRYVVAEGMENHPVVYVSWYGAEAYCLWAGKRLATEAEWEYAARGSDGRKFPWGSSEPGSANPIANCNGMRTGTSPVGEFDDASPFGCRDMAGNVLEWCSDWYDADYYRHSPAKDPQGPVSGRARVCRGGCFHYDAYSVRATYRVNVDPAHIFEPTGFRCAMSA